MGIYLGFLAIFILSYAAFIFWGEWKVAQGDLEREKKRHAEEVQYIKEKYRNKEFK